MNIEEQIQEQIDTTASQTIKNHIDFANTPVVDIVNNIIYDAAKAGASDIHFDHLEKCLRVRIRIDGLLNDYADIPNDVKNNVITRIKIISGMNITETRLPQDGAIKTTLSDLNLDMRVSSLPTKKGEKVVIRILDYTRSLKGIEYLFFSEENYKKILRMIGEPNGIILVTGATGSGKSTTVYSFLQRLNVKGTNLITVEDPVEMDIEGINQVQVNSDIGLDFANVLRSILRQDPNVIMIGEIRDSETARIAVRASITGHLVLSTLHTNNSLTTIERLLDMDVERYLLATALSGIISQKLARQLCDKCKKLRETTKYEKEMFHKFLNMDVKEIYEANGCSECNGGYHGRIAIQEVLLITPDIRDAVNARMQKAELRKLVYNKNVITLLQDGLYKVLGGFTTIEEIIKLTEADDEINAETQVKSQIAAKNDEDSEEKVDKTEEKEDISEKTEIKTNANPTTDDDTKSNTKPDAIPNTNININPIQKPDTIPNTNININPVQNHDVIPNTNISLNPTQKPDTNSNITFGLTPAHNHDAIPNTNIGLNPTQKPDTIPNTNIGLNPTQKPDAIPNTNIGLNPTQKPDTNSNITFGLNPSQKPDTNSNITFGLTPAHNHDANPNTNIGLNPTQKPDTNSNITFGLNPAHNSDANSNTILGLNLGQKRNVSLGPNVGVNFGTNTNINPNTSNITENN